MFAWAGKFRTVNISKGGHSFASADLVEACLNDLFGKLAKERYLHGAGASPVYAGEINAVHPFREGTGRTQREFIKQLARAAGFAIDWRGTIRDRMIAASRESFLTGSLTGLLAIIAKCLR